MNKDKKEDKKENKKEVTYLVAPKFWLEMSPTPYLRVREDQLKKYPTFIEPIIYEEGKEYPRRIIDRTQD
jgi:hypothetical protein